MSSKESLVNVQLLKRVEEPANNYEIESDGIRCCLPVKVNKKTSTLLLTVGFFVYIENNTVIAYPWSQLESCSRNKDTHGTDFVFKTKSETADLHVTSIPKKIIDKFFATVKEIAVGLSPKIPKFNPSDGLKFSSRPDVLLSVLLGRNNPYLNQISSYFCNRPKIFNISYFISNPNIVKKIFKVVDLTASIDTFVIDCDISPIYANVYNFLKDTKSIKRLVFDFSITGIIPNFNIPGIFQAVIENTNPKSLVDLFFCSFFINDITLQSLSTLLENKKMNSIVIHKSLFSYNYNDFMSFLSSKRYFKQLNKFIISELIYEGNALLDPSLLFTIAQGIPKVGISNCQCTFGALPVILQKCEQSLSKNPQSVNLSSIIATIDFQSQIVFNANIRKIIFQNSLWTKMNLFKVIEAAFSYQSNDLIIDLSNAQIVDNDWATFWRSMLSLTSKSSNYIVGFIWNGNPIEDVLFQVLGNCPRLKRVSFARPTFMTQTSSSAAFNLIRNLKYIEKIDLTNWSLTAEVISDLAKKLEAKSTLSKLFIGYNELSHNALHSLKNLILKVPGLKQLQIYSPTYLGIPQFITFVQSIEERTKYIDIKWPQEYATVIGSKADLDLLFSLMQRLRFLPRHNEPSKDTPPSYKAFPRVSIAAPSPPQPALAQDAFNPFAIEPTPSVPAIASVHMKLDDFASNSMMGPSVITTDKKLTSSFGPDYPAPPLGSPAQKQAMPSTPPASPLTPPPGDSPYADLVSNADLPGLQSSLPKAKKAKVSGFQEDMDLRTMAGGNPISAFMTRKLKKPKDDGDDIDASWKKKTIGKIKEKEPHISLPDIDMPDLSHKEYIDRKFDINELIYNFKSFMSK